MSIILKNEKKGEKVYSGRKRGKTAIRRCPALSKEARAELEKGNGNPRTQPPNRTKDYRDRTLH
jgi:hypothetical protein